jgi:hypothetical protein
MAEDLTPAAKLANLLETLDSADRREIVAWLFTGNEGARQRAIPPVERLGELRRQVGGWLPVGEGTQLVTIRLPTDQHERLRTWCTEHSFTMAAVVRGLVERFLDDQGGPASAQQ